MRIRSADFGPSEQLPARQPKVKPTPKDHGHREAAISAVLRRRPARAAIVHLQRSIGNRATSTLLSRPDIVQRNQNGETEDGEGEPTGMQVTVTHGQPTPDGPSPPQQWTEADIEEHVETGLSAQGGGRRFPYQQVQAIGDEPTGMRIQAVEPNNPAVEVPDRPHQWADADIDQFVEGAFADRGTARSDTYVEAPAQNPRTGEGLTGIETRVNPEPKHIMWHENMSFRGIGSVREAEAGDAGGARGPGDSIIPAGVGHSTTVPETTITNPDGTPATHTFEGFQPGSDGDPGSWGPVTVPWGTGNVEVRAHGNNPRAPKDSLSHHEPTISVDTPARRVRSIPGSSLPQAPTPPPGMPEEPMTVPQGRVSGNRGAYLHDAYAPVQPPGDEAWTLLDTQERRTAYGPGAHLPIGVHDPAAVPQPTGLPGDPPDPSPHPLPPWTRPAGPASGGSGPAGSGPAADPDIRDPPAQHRDRPNLPSVIVEPQVPDGVDEENLPVDRPFDGLRYQTRPRSQSETEPTASSEFGEFIPLDHVASQEGGQTPAQMDAARRGRLTTSSDSTPGEERIRTQHEQTSSSTGEFDEIETTSSQAGFELGRGGPQISGGRTRQVVYDDGYTSAQTHSSSINADGEVGYAYSSRRGQDGEQRTNSAGATARLGDTGIEGAEVSARRSTQDGRSVSFGAGYRVDIKKPVRADGGWRITGTITYSAHLGGGAESQGTTRRVGGAGQVTGTRVERFTRPFSDRAKATEFYDDNTALFGLAQLQAFGGVDADSIDELAVGESLGETDSLAVGISGTAGTAYLQAGASFTISGSIAVDIERISATIARATIRSMAGYDLGASLSGIGVGMGFTGGESDISGAVIEYRIDQAAGRRALDRFIATERPPARSSGPGWTVTERIVSGTESRSGSSINVLISGQTQSTTTVEQVEDAEGNRTVRATGRRVDTVASLLPDWLDEQLGLSGSSSVEMQSQTGRGLTLTFQIDGTDARASNDLLSQAIGEGYRARIDGADAGAWRLTTSMNERSFRALVRDISQNTASAQNATAWLLGRSDRGAELRDAVRATPSPDACRVLLADFVADLGAKGAGYVRRIAGELRWDVELTGSNTFTGEAGRERGRSRLEEIVAGLRASGNLGAAVASLEQLLAEQRQQVARMSREGGELPASLREQESTLQQVLIDDIQESLRSTRRRQATQGPRSAAEEIAEETTTAAVEATTMSIPGAVHESSVEHHATRMHEVSARRAQRSSARAALDGDLERAQRANSQQRRARGPIVRERLLNERGVSGFAGARPPRSYLSSIFGGEASTYERIDGRWNAAERHRERGEELMARANDAASAIRDDDGTSPAAAHQVQEARRLSWRAKNEFAAALSLWRTLSHDFRGLRNRNPEVEGFEQIQFGQRPQR